MTTRERRARCAARAEAFNGLVVVMAGRPPKVRAGNCILMGGVDMSDGGSAPLGNAHASCLDLV